jgi:hypothetical protein
MMSQQIFRWILIGSEEQLQTKVRSRDLPWQYVRTLCTHSKPKDKCNIHPKELLTHSDHLDPERIHRL